MIRSHPSDRGNSEPIALNVPSQRVKPIIAPGGHSQKLMFCNMSIGPDYDRESMPWAGGTTSGSDRPMP